MSGDVLNAVVLDTGEIVNLKISNGKSPPWAKIIQRGAGTLYKMDLSPIETKLIWYVLHKLKFGNICIINQSAVAAEIFKSRQAVNGALKSLCDRGILSQDKRTSGGAQYRLSIAIGIKGEKN